MNIANMYEWPRTTKILVFLLVFAVTFYVGYFYDLAQLKMNLSASKQQESDLKLQLESGIQRQIKIKKDIARFPAITEQLAEWQKKLIHRSQLPELLNDILKLAGTSHLYVSSFDPGEEVKAGDYYRMPITIMVVGDYHQIGDFISRISNMPLIVSIDNFSMTTEIKSDVLGEKLAKYAATEHLLTASLMLDVFYQAEKSK